MREEEKKKFFARRPNHQTVHMGGKKVALDNFPEEEKNKVLKRLSEKDEVANEGRLGKLPGIKIDGKQVTKDNIKDFELERMSNEEIEKVKENIEATKDHEEEKVKEENKYSKKELEAMSFKELKKVGKKFGTTDRSKKNLISEILNLQ